MLCNVDLQGMLVASMYIWDKTPSGECSGYFVLEKKMAEDKVQSARCGPQQMRQY